MDENDIRNALLGELIDKMHSRMADKMFPPDPDKTDMPAAAGIPMSEAMTDDKSADAMPEHGDDISDEDLDEMMKDHAC